MSKGPRKRQQSKSRFHRAVLRRQGDELARRVAEEVRPVVVRKATGQELVPRGGARRSK